MKTKVSILITIFALTLVSCLKNEVVLNTDDFVYRSLELAGPLARVHVPMYESLKKWTLFDSITVDDKGLIYVKFTRTEKIKWINDLSIDEFSSQNSIQTSNWTYDLSNLGTSLSDQKTFQIKMTTADEAKDSYVSNANLDGGKLRLSFDPVLPEGLTVSVKINELTDKNDNNRTFEHIFNHLSLPLEKDLTGYEIHTDANHNLNMECTFNFTGGSTPPTGTLKVDFRLSDLNVHDMSGYFGQFDRFEVKQIPFTFFDKMDFNGDIGFREGGEITATITNWTGIPFELRTNRINFIDDNIQLMKESFDVIVESATMTGNEVKSSETVSSAILTNIEISNITDENYPADVEIEFNGKGNPLGNTGKENFINKDNPDLAKVDLTFTLPLWLYFENYFRSDIIDFEYNELVGNDDIHVDNNVQYVKLYLSVDNNMPFDLNLNVYVINADIYSERILTDKKIESHNPKQLIQIELTKDQLIQFKDEDVRYIVFETQARTDNVEEKKYVQIKEEQYLNIDVSMSVKANIPSNIFD